MAGRTANYGTKADYSIVLSAFCHFRGNQWDLKSTWNPCNMNISVLHIVPEQAIHCSAQKFGRDKFVEAGSYDTDLDVLRNQLAFKCFHF